MLILALLIAVLAAAPTAVAADAQLVKVGDFNSPVYVTAPPGDPSRLFVVERNGTVALLKNDGTRKTFIDITTEVGTPAGESGLLSMAFAPDYATSGRFYLYDAHDASDQIRILEFQRSASDPDVADTSTRRVALALDGHNAGNHWGGTAAFGSDGLLYIAPGDNAGGSSTAQNPTSPFGKLLRFDPTASSPPQTVVGLGLRNPFRFSFDRGTGDLVIGDVGQDTHEEIDFVPRGEITTGMNFGWQTCEGFTCSGTAPANYVPPVFDYPHAGGACSITGGVVVRDPSLTALAGRYVYADLCVGAVRSIALAKPNASGDAAVALDGAPTTLNQPAGFGEDASGCVYVASLGAGAVYRLAPPGGASTCLTAAPTPTPTPTPTPGPNPTPPRGIVIGLATAGQQKQRILRQKGIRIGVRCRSTCTIRAKTSLLVGKKRYKLGKAKVTVKTPNKTVVVTIPLTAKAQKAVVAALKRGRTALATVSFSAKASTATDTETRRARLIR